MRPLEVPPELVDELERLRQRVRELEQARRDQAPLPHASSDHYKLLYENTPSMSFALATDGTVLSVNRFGEEQLGYECGQLIGRSVLLVFARPDHETVRNQLRLCAEHPYKIFQWEIQKIHRTGRRLWVKETARAVHDDRGSLIVLVMCEDITARKVTEEEARSLTSALEALIHTSPLAIMGLDPSGNTVTLWNQAAEQMFGWSAEEAIGKPTPFLTEKQRDQSEQLWNQLVRDGSLHAAELHRVRKDGTPIVLSLWATLLRDPHGNITDTFGLLADITEIKRIEAALRLNEQAVRELYEITSEQSACFDKQIRAVLDLGRRRFQLPIAAFTTVKGDHLELTAIQSDLPAPAEGALLPLCDTYCAQTLATRGSIAIEHVGQSEWNRLPAYHLLKFESYLGTSLTVGGQAVGTVCFMDYARYTRQFSDADKDFLLLMARWITRELDRRNTDQALKEQEALLRSVIETATDSIFMKDQDGRYRFINSAGASVIGRPVEEIVGKTDLDIFPPETARRLMADDRQVLTGAAQGRFEAILPHNAEERTFYSIKTPHQNQQGDVVGLVGVSRDMTDMKRAEDERRKTQQLFASFMDNLPGLAWVKDLDGRYVYLNGAFEHAFGTTIEAWKGKTDFDVLPKAIAEQFMANDHRVLETKAPIQAIESAPQIDGIHESLVSKFPISNADGVPVLIGGVAVDITEQRQAQAKLRDSEERFRLMFENAPVGMAIVGTDWKLKKINPAFLRLVGYSEEEILGNTYALYTHPDDLASNLTVTEQFFRGEISNYHLEKRYIRKDGQLIWVAVTVSSLQLPGDPERLLLAIIEDITNRKLAESQLRFTQFAVDHAGDLIFWIDRDANLLYANDAAVQRLGYSREELTRLTVADLDPNYQAAVWPHHWNELRLKKRLRFESVHRTKSGDLYPAEIVANFVEFEGKEYNFAFARDISERKRAEKALQDNQARLQEAERIAKTGHWYLDVATNRLTWSEGKYRLFGVTPEGFHPTLENILARVHPDDVESTRATLAHLAQHRQAVKWEFRIFRPDGAVRTIYCTGEPRSDESGKLTALIGTALDVTELKQAESALRESEERFSKAFRSSPHPMVVTELDTGRCLEVNDASLNLFGFRREDVIGQSTLTLGLWPSEADRNAFFERLKREGSLRNAELTFYTKSRSPRRCLISCELFELNGTQCIVTVGTDITEQKRAEEALRRSEQAVRQAFEDRERLSQDLHDNLLQSLYAVGMGLELTKQKLQRISQTNAKRLEGSVGQLNGVIREVRNFIPRMQPPVVADVTIAEALHSLVQSFQSTGTGPIQLQVEEDAAAQLTLEQGTNLLAIAKEALSNSIRHAQATERAVSVCRDKGAVQLTVKDNGRGFTATRRRARGHGLKNMRARARKLHARLSITSSPKQGTVVSLRIPLR